MRTIAYVACPESGEIALLRLDPESGAIADQGRVAVNDIVMPLAVSPDRRFMYAGLRGEKPAIASFRIDPATGDLTELSRVPVPSGNPYLSTDRQGRFLLAAAFFGNTIATYPIGERGFVQGQPVAMEHNLPTAHCIVVDPSNRFTLTPVRDSDMIVQRRFDAATGMLSPNNPPVHRLRSGAGPRHLVFHPNGRFVYIVNETDATVDACGFDPIHGTLSAIQTQDLLAPGTAGTPAAAEIDITPDGRFLYASERLTNVLCAFAVNAESGKLARIGSFPTQAKPRGFAIDARGRFLLAAGQTSHALTVHAIDQQSGALRELSRHPIGQGACWVEIVELP